MIKALKYAAIFSGAITFIDIVGGPAVVQGSSMEPTLNPPDSVINDVVWLNRFAAKTGSIQRGDIITIYCPTEPNEMHIKRVIGLPGDFIFTDSSGLNTVKVPPGHCWVEGDNRLPFTSTSSSGFKRTWTSKDSNVYGPVSLGLVDSRVSWVVFPFHRVRHLKSTEPEKSRFLLKGKFDDVAESLIKASSQSHN